MILLVLMIFLLAVPARVHAQDGETSFGVLEPVEVAPGSNVQVAVAVKGVEGLYAVDFVLEYDPDIVQVVDADTSLPGIQAGLGTFLDPGLLLINEADNQVGKYHFVMSQYNPSLPKSGDGNIVVLTFRGMAAGESPLTISSSELLNGEIAVIEPELVNSTIKVATGAAAQAATIPVAQATGLIIIEESTPTATPTTPVTPTATQRPQAGLEPGADTAAVSEDADLQDPAQKESGIPGNTGDEKNSPWLVNNWWLPVVVLAVLFGGGYTLLRSGRKSKNKEEINEDK